MATSAGAKAANARSATAARHHRSLEVVSATRASAPREPPLSSPFSSFPADALERCPCLTSPQKLRPQCVAPGGAPRKHRYTMTEVALQAERGEEGADGDERQPPARVCAAPLCRRSFPPARLQLACPRKCSGVPTPVTTHEPNWEAPNSEEPNWKRTHRCHDRVVSRVCIFRTSPLRATRVIVSNSSRTSGRPSQRRRG